jgi:hypothetical protein
MGGIWIRSHPMLASCWLIDRLERWFQTMEGDRV